MSERNQDLERHIVAAEDELVEVKERLAALRREREPYEIEDYVLERSGGRQVRLSDLFGGRRDLIVIHNMGKGCSYCTLWADGLNGVLEHLENRSAVVLVSPDDAEAQEAFAESRGWGFELASARGSSFTRDLGFEEDNGAPLPGVTTLARDDGRILRVGGASFGPGDDFCGVWHLLDLLDAGADGWEPRHAYDSESPK